MILTGVFVTFQSLGYGFILALHQFATGLSYMPLVFKLCVAITFIPLVSATPQTQSFPDVPFSLFSNFIEQTFNSKVSLATVLLVLFSLTENPELLTLHARQQHPKYKGENKTVASGWMRALSCAMMHQLKNDFKLLFHDKELPDEENQQVTKLCTKLDNFSKLLQLTPYDHNNKFRGKLLPVSYNAIRGIPTICPNTPVCLNAKCEPRGLLQATMLRDIPLVTLIKENTVYQDVPVLTGKCTTCDTTYHGDHERFKDSYGIWNKCYLNSARFLKIGQNVWANRKFCHSVLSSVYNFHASTSAFMQFWNDCNSTTNFNVQVMRRQVWQAFVQESIRTIASSKSIELELKENLNIQEVTAEAFAKLGHAGIIEPGKAHSCSQCSQPHKAHADFMVNEDPAAVVGVDENRAVPVLEGEYANLSAQETTAERRAACIRANNINNSATNDMDVNYDNCKMIVLDGIVFGPKVKLIIIVRSFLINLLFFFFL
jgi:CxC5 like cysteine cluster associated with KDZ transposases